MAVIVFDILSFWQVGSGSGDMGTFDSRAARNDQGLPVIPGRQVKGLCRQAVRDAEKFGLVGAGTGRAMFGDQPPVGDPTPGALRFASAELPEADRAALIGRHDLITALFVTRRSTALNNQGTALRHSLRMDELVIPLRLRAEVWPLPSVPADWQEMLARALTMLTAVGADRTRGLGRTLAWLEGAP